VRIRRRWRSLSAERQAKLRLAYALNQVLDGRKLSQADAA
jgi:hypothetical protein